MAPITKTSPEGYKVILYKLKETDPNKFIFEEALKVFLAFNDIRISEDGIVPGYIVIFDMKGCSMGHFARSTPYMNYIKAFMMYIQVSKDFFRYILFQIYRYISNRNKSNCVMNRSLLTGVYYFFSTYLII